MGSMICYNRPFAKTSGVKGGQIPALRATQPRKINVNRILKINHLTIKRLNRKKIDIVVMFAAENSVDQRIDVEECIIYQTSELVFI